MPADWPAPVRRVDLLEWLNNNIIVRSTAIDEIFPFLFLSYICSPPKECAYAFANASLALYIRCCFP